MKPKRIIIFCCVVVAVLAIVKIFYPILEISAVYPPMEQYTFSIPVENLVDKIREVGKEDTQLTFKITDTTGTRKTGLCYFADLNLKSHTTSYTFKVFYESDKQHAKIGLVGAFDNYHKIGSYQNNSKDIQELIDVFKQRFINRLYYDY